MGVSFILAFTYYIQIFKFAKREQAEFEEALAAAQAAIQASHHTASENGTSINGMYVLSWFGSVVYGSLFWFSLNQHSAAQ